MPPSWGPWDPQWEDGEEPGIWRATSQPLINMLIVSMANDAWLNSHKPARKTSGEFFWCVSTHSIYKPEDLDAGYKLNTFTGTEPTLGAAQRAVKRAANHLMRVRMTHKSRRRL
jgi:hypothetical protein